MGQVINTNSLSLLTQNNLNKSQSALNTSIQRLSSGLRINSAKDDAAGQAIANRFSANIKGLSQAQRNANDGISLAQTTEGALNEINTNLQRIRELTVQSTNGSNSATDLDSIQAEITQRMAEIDRTSAQTDFNGTKVLAGGSALAIQVGANDGETININLQKIDTTSLSIASFNVNGTGTVNTAATEDGLALKAAYTTGTAGAVGSTTNSKWIQGATVAGTTAYDQTVVTTTVAATAADTSNRAAATSANVFAAVAAASTVVLNGSAATIDTFVASGAPGSLNFNSTTGAAAVTTNATVASQLIPTAGGQTNAVVTIGGSDQSIQIDSTGNVTDASGTQLYLDTTGNLTLNSGGSLGAATIGGGGAGDLLASMNDATVNTNAGAQLGKIVVTTAGGSTVTFDGGTGAAAGGNKWDYTNDLTAADMQAKMASATTALVDVDGVGGTVADAYTITNATGAVKSDAGGANLSVYVNTYAATPATQLSTTQANSEALVAATTTSVVETYYAHSNGAVMDNAGNKVFADSDVTNLKGFTLNDRSGSTSTVNAMSVLDAALAKVDELRGSLGAVQNRFDSIISNLGTTITNLSSSRSRIEDADYATEVSNMTRAQILQQAGTSVLAKANQSTQGVLSLLQ